MSEPKIVVEGRFGEPGAKPVGLLGAVSRHWDVVCGRQRKMGVTEQWLARAITRAFLETADAVEQDGLMVLKRESGPDYDEKILTVEQDVGSLKMVLADLRGFVQARLDEVVGMIAPAADKMTLLEEKILALESERAKDIERLSAISAEVEKLRQELALFASTRPAHPTHEVVSTTTTKPAQEAPTADKPPSRVGRPRKSQEEASAEPDKW